MTDLTQYHDNELLDWFLNDEYLYSYLQTGNNTDLMTVAKSHFIYTNEQLFNLVNYDEND